MTAQVIDLQLFRYAIAAAEHGSFRRAAMALNVQQSSVSKAVRGLERRVGTALFERSYAGVRLTPIGERFLEEATRGFDHLERAMQRVGATHRGDCGELTVAASLPFTLIADSFERYRRDYADVSVEIVEVTSASSIALVEQRKVDFAFSAKAPDSPGIEFLQLRNERLTVVLPKAHRLATARAVVLEEIQREKFIFSAGGIGPDISDYIQLRLGKSGMQTAIQLHRVGQWDLVNMVGRGFGITITVGAGHLAVQNDVAVIPLAGGHVIGLHAVWMSSNPNPALKPLLNIVRASGPADRSGH